MQLSHDQELVLSASRVHCDDKALLTISAMLDRGPVDWPSVLQLAIPHGTLPLIARNLLMVQNLRLTACPGIPVDFLAQLTRYSDRIRNRNGRARLELVRVIEAMRRRNIEPIPFKGPALEGIVYPEPGLREYADMDVMVRRSELSAAIDTMLQLGYSLSARQQLDGMQLLIRQDEALEFVQEGMVSVDLHWCFCPKSFEFRLDPESLRRDCESAVMDGTKITVYSPENTLLMLCGHQAKHLMAAIELAVRHCRNNRRRSDGLGPGAGIGSQVGCRANRFDYSGAGQNSCSVWRCPRQ